MVKLLVAGAMAWPLLLGAVVWQGVARGDTPWTALVRAAAARVCHQRPERSFQTAGVQWPVCGRCSGLYLAAPFGALFAAGALRRRRTSITMSRVRAMLLLAAVPTAITLILEFLHLAPMSNGARFAAALPLGAAVAFTLVSVLRLSGPAPSSSGS